MKSIRCQFLLIALFSVVWNPCCNGQNPSDTKSSIVTPGTIWAGRNEKVELKLTITERAGSEFRGLFAVGDNILRDVKGTVKDDQLFWYARDVKPIKGKPGHDNFGKIIGDKIDFVFREANAPKSAKDSGEFTLKLIPTSKPGPSSNPLTAIQTDANQPRIEVIKDQGPNATEWALTPLDESIPGDIRQNLTYLREDLLDEAKKNPKAAAAAYTLASDYCDKILNALDQRDLARVNAGYSAAQADAGINVTSQALEARRNYKMSWPQYAREQSQRAELYRQQTAGADVSKQQIKVDWAKRAVQMRAYLDDLYTKLRAAMR